MFVGHVGLPHFIWNRIKGNRFLYLISTGFSVNITDFVIRCHVAGLLGDALFMGLPTVEFRVLASFLIKGLIILPPFSQNGATFFGGTRSFLGFLRGFFRHAGYTHPGDPSKHVNVMDDVRVVERFVCVDMISPNNKQTFFSGSVAIKFYQCTFYFVTTASFDHQFRR